MPSLWSGSVDAHRQAVRDAALAATATLVRERGVPGATMSAIAQRAGIGRATLYKYFPDLRALLEAWHEQQVEEHLNRLIAVRDIVPEPERVGRVLIAYGAGLRRPDGGELTTLLHGGRHVQHARARLVAFLAGLLSDDVRAGRVRDDIPVDELAAFCVEALDAAVAWPDDDAVERLVRLVLSGIRPVASTPPGDGARR